VNCFIIYSIIYWKDVRIMYNKRINIVYYSGTGGTERVAKCFETAFKQIGYDVRIGRLVQNTRFNYIEEAPILLLYAVHACNAPELVYKWIDSIGPVNDIPAVVISVSGGGEVIPNTACRISSIKRLEKKGYKVIYEKMLVMPSNWIVATKKPLAQMLLDVLPKKVKAIVDDIENGTTKRTKPFLIDRLFSYIGEFEKPGARSFGKRIMVSEKCTGCGWCVENCPASNITLNLNKSEFGNRCHLCLCCIYGCPAKALEPGIGKFVVIKEGYSLNELENTQPLKECVGVETLAKSYLWSGVRKYLLEQD